MGGWFRYLVVESASKDDAEEIGEEEGVGDVGGGEEGGWVGGGGEGEGYSVFGWGRWVGGLGREEEKKAV